MEISEIRNRIDSIDAELLKLFVERMDMSSEAARYKAEKGEPILNRQREREILKNVSEHSGEYAQYAHRLFSSILELSRARQAAIIKQDSQVAKLIETALKNGAEVFPHSGLIACQGVEGAYSQLACDRLFPQGNIMYMRTFEAVFDAVDSGLCQFGILPIENSTGGSVRSVYSLIQKKRFSIVRSVKLFIRHELLAVPGTQLKNIKEIYSHEQAIAQCSKFLATLSPDVKIIPCDNTAVAAKMASQCKDGTVAAISSHNCAELYGLTAVETHVQNSENNYTRFICITKEPAIYAGANRISLMLTTAHRPGALFEIMSKFAALDINLTKLESQPIIGQDFEFMFFFDLEASVLEPGVVGMLSELERSCESFQFLGSYAEV